MGGCTSWARCRRRLTGHRGDVAATAPRITIMNVPKEKIREVIGTGGKVIREIVEQTGCKVDIEDDGTIKIAATDALQAQRAIDWIRGIVAEPEIGMIYNGKVVKTADFGAFVNFLGSRDGLVHISELQQGRVGKTTRRGECRRPGEGEGPWLRRPRQGEAVDAGGRSGDRRGHHREGRRQAWSGRPGSRSPRPRRTSRAAGRGRAARGCRAAGDRRVAGLLPPTPPAGEGGVRSLVTVVSYGL